MENLIDKLKEIAFLSNAVRHAVTESEYGNNVVYYFNTESDRNNAISLILALPKCSIGGMQKGNYYSLNVSF